MEGFLGGKQVHLSLTESTPNQLFLSSRRTTGVDAYEIASALASQDGHGGHHTDLLSHFQPLVRPHLSMGKCSTGTNVQAWCCDNNRLQHELGRCMQGACNFRALNRTLFALTHQLPRVVGCDICPEVVPSTGSGQTRVDPHEQHCSGGVHQLPGRCLLPSHVTSRPPSPPLESAATESCS